jgi:hypothetical protein
MAVSNIQARRKKRELEAKRDRLLEQSVKTKTELAKVRAELKSTRTRRKTQ